MSTVISIDGEENIFPKPVYRNFDDFCSVKYQSTAKYSKTQKLRLTDSFLMILHH